MRALEEGDTERLDEEDKLSLFSYPTETAVKHRFSGDRTSAELQQPPLLLHLSC